MKVAAAAIYPDGLIVGDNEIDRIEKSATVEAVTDHRCTWSKGVRPMAALLARPLLASQSVRIELRNFVCIS